MRGSRWSATGRTLVTPGDPSPLLMGVLNVTPDSFSDGGRYLDVEAALRHARRLAEEGAGLIDVGGESTRPGAAVVDLGEEIRRVVPVVDAVMAGSPGLAVAVDTSKVEVARLALAAGAVVINDVTGLADPAMTRLAAETGAGVVLMHMPGDPRTMQIDPRYDDVTAEVYEFLARRVEQVEAGGVPRGRVAVDPGIGFGKTHAHNLELLRNLGRFATLGCAVLVGTSRKGFLGKVTGRAVGARATASAVSALAAATQGADVLRVHDVAETADALKVWAAIVGWA